MPKPKSYERINYSLRIAKNIERKMLVEALQMLRSLAPLRFYRYIGMGSTFFSDFRLIHRSLGVRNMVSIEARVGDRARIAFNRPYRSIKLEFGRASVVLPRLTWRTKSIVWLDYDSPLDREILDDIRTVCTNAAGGSVLIATVKADPPESGDRDTVANLEKRVGPDSIPIGLKNADLKKWGTASVCRKIIDSTIRDAVSQRSRALPASRKVHYQQLFNFHYADGARMLTVGGLLFYGRQRADVDRADFAALPFVRDDADPYLIAIPSLTLREMKHLDRQLPSSTSSSLRGRRIPSRDLERYAELYRYFPIFVDADV